MAKKKGDAGPKGGAPAAVAAPVAVEKPAKAEKTQKPKTERRGRGRAKKKDEAADQVKRQELIAEALDYRRQGFQYRRIADAMGIAASTAYEYVQEGLQAIVLEPAEAVKKIALDQCEEIMQRLMPLLEDGAPGDVIDGILKVQERMLRLHGITSGIKVNLPGGGSVEGGDDGDSETVIIQRIKASAPVLKPDGPVPASPVL